MSIRVSVARCRSDRRLDAEQLWHPHLALMLQCPVRLNTCQSLPYFHKTCSCLIIFEIGEFKSHLRERTWAHVSPCAGCMTPRH